MQDTAGAAVERGIINTDTDPRAAEDAIAAILLDAIADTDTGARAPEVVDLADTDA